MSRHGRLLSVGSVHFYKINNGRHTVPPDHWVVNRMYNLLNKDAKIRICEHIACIINSSALMEVCMSAFTHSQYVCAALNDDLIISGYAGSQM